MRLPAAIGKLARPCGRGLCQCLNLGLAIVALLLTGLVLLNSLQRDVPLPDAWSHWVVQQLLPDDLLADWERAAFDLRGGLLVQGLVVRRMPSGEIALDAEAAWIKWSPLSAVFPNLLPFTSLEVSKARAYLPAQFSPAGLNEPALNVDQASIRVTEGRLEIQNLHLRAAGVQVIVRGAGPVKALLASLPERYPAPASRQAWLQRVREIPEGLTARLRVDWTYAAGDRHAFAVEALIPGLAYQQAGFENVRVRAALDTDGHGIRLKHLRASALLTEPGSLPLPDWLAGFPFGGNLPFDLVASGPATAFRNHAVPARLRLSAPLPLHPALPAHRLVLSAPLPDPAAGVDWILHGPRLFAAGTAHPAGPAAGFSPRTLDLAFRASLTEPTLAEWWPGHPDHRLLPGSRARQIAFTGTAATAGPSLAGFLKADDLFIGQTLFADIHARLRLDPQSLALDPIHVWKNPSESAVGSYHQHLPSLRFSLRASGAVLPASLDSLLGPWWPPIFTDIVTPAPIPANVTVWGFWRRAEPLESVTWAGGEGIRYRGLEVPRLEVRVRSNDDWAVLERLQAEFTEGSITGTIGWRQRQEEAARPVVVDLASDAPWAAVVAASGLAYLGDLEFTGRPQVRVRGILWDPVEADQWMEPDLRLELLDPQGVLRIWGLEFEDLQLSGRATRERVWLEPVAGDFAGGVFTGDVELLGWQDPGWRAYRLRLQLFDADFGEAARQLSNLAADPEAFRASFPTTAGEGRLEADFELLLGPAAALGGSGRLSLRQARIGQIHLIGGLSRFLADRGLGFSSLDLKAATLEWQLQPGTLQLERFLLTGPVLSLDMAGTLDLESRMLNLRADLLLFRGLLGRLLAPVSENFQFDVTGPLADPSWQLRISPLRWFQERLPLPSLSAP